MAQAAPALSAEILDKINIRMTEQYAAYKAGATAENKAAAVAQLAQYKSDPEFANSHKAKMAKAYADADADGDGRLNFAEYQVWEAALQANQQAMGRWSEIGKAQENFDIINMVSEGDSISMDDFRAVAGPMMVKFEELKAADEAQ